MSELSSTGFKSSVLRITFLILLVFGSIASYAQKSLNPFPYVFEDVYSTVHQLNPSMRFSDGSRLSFGYNSYPALSKKLNTMYGYASFKTNDAQYVGLQFIGNQEGSFLSRNRIQGQYSYGIQINDDLVASAGAMVGITNNILKANVAVGGESTIVPDANLGLVLEYKGITFGFSSIQVLDSKIEFLSKTYNLKRFYAVQLAGNKEINEHLSTLWLLHYRTHPESWNKIIAGLETWYDKKVMISGTYKHGNGVALGVGGHFGLNEGKGIRGKLLYKLPLTSYVTNKALTIESVIEYYF